jgi:hypothetical protein
LIAICPDRALPDVFLDDIGRANFGPFRIAARFMQSAPLPQQIPALIELDLDVRKAVVVAFAERILREKMMLLGDELLNVGEHLSLGLALCR